MRARFSFCHIWKQYCQGVILMEKTKVLEKLNKRKTMFAEYLRQIKTPVKKQEPIKQPHRG